MSAFLETLGAAYSTSALWLKERFIDRGERRPLHSRQPMLALATLTLILVVLTAYTGIQIYARHCRQMRAISAIERLGGSVSYHSDVPNWLQRLQPDDALWEMNGLGPNWLRAWLPAKMIVDHVWVVDTVWLDNGPGSRPLTNISGQSRNEDLWGEPIDPDDDDLAVLAGLPGLESVYLRNTRITDAGLRHLQNLRNITHISLGKTRITDKGLEIVATFEKLQTVRLFDTRITDAGITKLMRLTHLAELDVRSTQLTKSGLATLRARAGLSVMCDDLRPGRLSLVTHY